MENLILRAGDLVELHFVEHDGFDQTARPMDMIIDFRISYDHLSGPITTDWNGRPLKVAKIAGIEEQCRPFTENSRWRSPDVKSRSYYPSSTYLRHLWRARPTSLLPWPNELPETWRILVTQLRATFVHTGHLPFSDKSALRTLRDHNNSSGFSKVPERDLWERIMVLSHGFLRTSDGWTVPELVEYEDSEWCRSPRPPKIANPSRLSRNF